VSNDGPGRYEFTSLHGQNVVIYGQGVYKHNSAEVAVQGIAHDVVTLFLGIPALLFSLWLAQRGLLKGRLLLTGVLGYFTLSYFMYMMISMYNPLFMLWIIIGSLSSFAFALTLFSFELKTLDSYFEDKVPNRAGGYFLIFNAVIIGLLWLSRIIPPLLAGELPTEILQHYTTMPVQGIDLAYALPLGVLSGIWFLQRKPIGYLFGPAYLIFLVILMTALVAKVAAQGRLEGVVSYEPLIIMGTLGLTALVLSFLTIQSIREKLFIRHNSSRYL